MKLSMRWLADYVTVDTSIARYVEDMTMSGSKVEGYLQEQEQIQNVVVGHVLAVEKHPNADSLVICRIDVGEKEVQIVTGAKNVVAGALVPVALHKSRLPNGTVITKGKLRGEVSEGMLCSLAELGLSPGDFPYAEEDGIFLLQEECQIGESIQQVLGLNDTIVEFEITSNRADCLSVLGLARETAATYGRQFVPAVPQLQTTGRPIQELLQVTVENTALCKRYMAAAVEHVTIGPSPRWLRERLRAAGVRPMNNIVDITNFVMLEYGQPLHAFDLRHVAGGRIVVRNAKVGECITTLDGVERRLETDMLIIADAEKPTAVAGVMGGEYSGVSDDTTTIIFESACFDGASVRHSAKKLGMRTESSGRFEKGLDSRNCENALKRACELVELLGAGTVCDGMIDKDFDPYMPTAIPLDVNWINEYVGIQATTEEMEHILSTLGFTIQGDTVIVPPFRASDVLIINDLAEEVARIYGYNRIPTTVIRGEAKGKVSSAQHYRTRVENILLAQGFSEIKTYSFFSPKQYDQIGIAQNSELRQSVIIRNPLGEDTSVLRTTALPSMLQALSANYHNRNDSAYLFEIAKEYHVTGDLLPNEAWSILLGQYGTDSDFFTLKGALEALMESLSVRDLHWKAQPNNPTYHSGRCADIWLGEEYCGTLGQIHPYVAETFDITTETYLAQLDYAVLFAHMRQQKIYRPLPKYPALHRDLALVADIDLPVAAIEAAVTKAIGPLLEQLVLFDVYMGNRIEAGKKSVAYTIVLRAKDHTLTDEECEAAVSKALQNLKTIGVALRS